VRLKDGSLAIAKFPRRDDEINVVAWEAVALALARKAGIATPAARLEDVGGKPVLVVTRFDRVMARRKPFLSAMSMLGAKNNESRSYLEFVDVLRQYGAAPVEDMEALWRRIVLTILISNTDDHLRNHAFLYEGQTGWRLSPAYDLNPVPIDIKPRVLVTAITEEDNTASLVLAFEVAGRCARAEVDLGRVALRQADELRLEPRRRTGQEKEQAGRERVERPCVPGPSPGLAPDRRDDRE
jgi:serine/threonine-protein kinase HipA